MPRADPYELEVRLQCDRTALLYARPNRLSGTVVEKSWRLFLREWGTPGDAIEYELLFNFFLLRHRVQALYDLMAFEGIAGFKAMGPSWTRMNRDLAVLGERLQAMKQARQAAGADDDVDEVDPEEAEELDEAEFARQEQEDFARAEAMTAREAAQVLADLSPDDRTRLLREEDEARERARTDMAAKGPRTIADVDAAIERMASNDGHAMHQRILKQVMEKVRRGAEEAATAGKETTDAAAAEGRVGEEAA
jgi:hypothetical protein